MSVRKTLAMDGQRIAAQTSVRKAMAALSQYGHLSSSHLFHRHRIAESYFIFGGRTEPDQGGTVCGGAKAT